MPQQVQAALIADQVGDPDSILDQLTTNAELHAYIRDHGE